MSVSECIVALGRYHMYVCVQYVCMCTVCQYVCLFMYFIYGIILAADTVQTYLLTVHHNILLPLQCSAIIVVVSDY